MITILLLLTLDVIPETMGAFSYTTHSPVPVTVTVGGVEVRPGEVYFAAPGTYKVTVRYHGRDDEYVTEEHSLTLSAGRTKRFTIRVPMPPTAVVENIPSENHRG